MGIKVEFNPDLALRNYFEFEQGNRKEEECLPKEMKKGEIYSFLKQGQRNYWLEGEVPLLETQGNQVLSRPLAAVTILEFTHHLIEGVPYTKGKYQIVEIFKDKKPHFDGYTRI
jgi:hypothetical protein